MEELSIPLNKPQRKGKAGEVSDEIEIYSEITCTTCLAIMLAAVGCFLFGYDTGIISGAMIFIRSPQNFNLNDGQHEVVVSVTIATASIGSLSSGILSRHIGRKGVILVAAAVFSVGGLFMAFAPLEHLWILILGRALIGLSIGSASQTVPVYIAEVSSCKLRGYFSVISVASITSGQVVAACVAYGFSFVGVTHGWRWMLGLSIVPSTILLAGFFFMPESPRWLVSRGKFEKARKSLQRLLKHKKISTDSIAEEVDQILQRIKHSQERHIERQYNDTAGVQIEKGKNGCSNISIRNALIVGCLLQAIQQFAGINTVMYYGANIVQDALGINATNATIAEKQTCVGIAAIIAGLNFVFTLLGLFLVVRIKRRVLTLGSLGLVIISLIMAGVSESIIKNSTMSLVSFGAYISFFAPGMGAMPWTINAEIYPQHFREAGTSLSTFVNWISNLIVSLTFLSLSHELNTLFEVNGTEFFLYAGICLLGFVCLLVMLPETKDVPLEKVINLFHTNICCCSLERIK